MSSTVHPIKSARENLYINAFITRITGELSTESSGDATIRSLVRNQVAEGHSCEYEFLIFYPGLIQAWEIR